MAFDKTNWALVSKGFDGIAPNTYKYNGGADDIGTIRTTGYFDELLNNIDNELRIGDLIQVQASDVYELITVTGVTTNITTDTPNSGTFTLNLTGGFTGAPRNVSYQLVGDIVVLRFDNVNLGTQSAAGVATSGAEVPVFLRTDMQLEQEGLVAIDNGTQIASTTTLNSDGTVVFQGATGGNFSGTGNLTLQEGPLTYLRRI